MKRILTIMIVMTSVLGTTVAAQVSGEPAARSAQKQKIYAARNLELTIPWPRDMLRFVAEKAMRVLRLLVAVLLASLSVLPVSAGMAKMHAAKAEMTVSASSDTGGDDCVCCSPTGKCSTRICMLECFNVPAVLIDGLPVTQPMPQLFVDIGWAVPSPFSPRPDPPPPRS